MAVLAIIFYALLIGSLFYFGFRRTGPWGSFWSFILILFLGMWLADIWVTPYGPEYWGIAWFDLLFVGLLFALILAAATPTRYVPPKDREITDKELVEAQRSEMAGGAVALGIFFWIMLILFFGLALFGLFA